MIGRRSTFGITTGILGLTLAPVIVFILRAARHLVGCTILPARLDVVDAVFGTLFHVHLARVLRVCAYCAGDRSDFDTVVCAEIAFVT